MAANNYVFSDPRELRLCLSLDSKGTGKVKPKDMKQAITNKGICVDDFRLKESMKELARFDDDEELSFYQLRQIIRPNIILLERILQGNLVIPDFEDFSNSLKSIFTNVATNEEGRVADCVPQLSVIDPSKWGMSLCTVDGQRLSLGDSEDLFSIQSCCKPINYCLALEEHGEQEVHKFVGREPSGQKFNEVIFNSVNRPHNPLINVGAIMCASLIKPGFDQATRLAYVLEQWKRLGGGADPTVDILMAESEEATGFRNFALAGLMMANGVFPQHIKNAADLTQVLQFYFQCCSIQVNAGMMAMVGATLANGGVCPGSGEAVFRPQTVRNCLSIMYSCGMYDFSGEFAFTIGLPAKSGVGGALLIIVPNVLGLCTWSPRLDDIGNSVRGLDFCRRMIAEFNFHNYDNLTGLTEKKDPRVSRIRVQAEESVSLIWGASKGDVGAMQRMVLNDRTRILKLEQADYDGRTAAHLAAANGQIEVLRYLVENMINLNPEDRWGGTPLDDAALAGNNEIVAMLKKNGARNGKNQLSLKPVQVPSSHREVAYEDIAELIWAASQGSLDTLERLVARGQRLDVADYDLRTPLHLAASEGHLEVVQYLVHHGHPPEAFDRWGNTPYDDAVRHSHKAVQRFLEESKKNKINLE